MDKPTKENTAFVECNNQGCDTHFRDIVYKDYRNLNDAVDYSPEETDILRAELTIQDLENNLDIKFVVDPEIEDYTDAPKPVAKYIAHLKNFILETKAEIE